MMASASQHRRAALLATVLFLASSQLAMRGAAAADNTTATADGCGTEKFPAGRSYANCTALPPLGALYWTYDAEAATLSVAFVAKPSGPSGAGWVAWGINTKGSGMAGAQCLLASPKTAGGGPYVVRTYNITGYGPLPAQSTKIAFQATDLTADESAGGKVRLYGKLQLDPDMKAVNHIWQVGSAVNNGAPAKHAFAKENLEAKGKLALVAGAEVAPAPAPAEAGASSSSDNAGSGGPAPSGGKGKSAATAATYLPVPVLAVLALVGFLATV